MTAMVTVPTQVSAEDFWGNILGSGWEAWDWWVDLSYSKGASWDVVGELTITAWDGETEGEATITKTLGIQDLVDAYSKCLAEGYRFNLDDFDSLQGDAIIQMAMFGEVVYG